MQKRIAAIRAVAPPCPATEARRPRLLPVPDRPGRDDGEAASDEAEEERRRALERRRHALLVRQTALLRSIVDFQDAHGLTQGLMALSDGIRTRFRCERVAVGLCDGSATTVAAISQQAVVDADAPETRLLGAAMGEAWRRGERVHLPADADASRADAGGSPSDTPATLAAHRALVDGRPNVSVVTVPMYCREQAVGALLLESAPDTPWNDARFELLEQLAASLAPMIRDRRAAGRSLARHARDALDDALERLRAPRHLVAKLGAAALLLALLGLTLVPVEHRIAADAELVPVRLRTVTAPVSGYISRVAVASGDAVREGQVLVELDARELVLERDGWRGELARVEAEARAARAAGERKEAAVLKARRDQARAQLALAEQRIARSRVVAPHDGLVLSGDLTRLVGAPVERGQRLVEIAPDEDWTVSLLVDERDIGRVAVGQHGALSLQARPGERLPFEISAVHPIADVGAAGTRFRVDAVPSDTPDDLLPGQTGIAKVHVGSASALRLLTGRFVNWLGMRRWEWLG